ncbi:transcriptional regulator [Bradyrhizobium sp. Pha-3]|uniref:winged helix-turn-helix domain-containing protein n=1 Tax=Bradyrhizobium sp. Pha-3 TaxID=208375 RepID=UPI0035D3F20D
MNGRSQQELSTERFGGYGNMFGQDRNRQDRDRSVLNAFCFGPFRIFPSARLLERDESPVPIGSRAFDLLCLLISRPGEVVSKCDLIAKAWPNVKVEESSLRFHMTMLRRALGDGQGGERYVVNIPGRGYCFVAKVRRTA